MKIIFANEEYNVPIVPQWEIYRYAPELHCTCGATEFRRNIVGLAEVKGAMMIAMSALLVEINFARISIYLMTTGMIGLV